MMPPFLHAPAAGQKIDLEIRYYGTKSGKYNLYDDDGETFDYEKGMYSWREIKVEPDKKGKPKGTISKSRKRETGQHTKGHLEVYERRLSLKTDLCGGTLLFIEISYSLRSCES